MPLFTLFLWRPSPLRVPQSLRLWRAGVGFLFGVQSWEMTSLSQWPPRGDHIDCSNGKCRGSRLTGAMLSCPRNGFDRAMRTECQVPFYAASKLLTEAQEQSVGGERVPVHQGYQHRSPYPYHFSQARGGY